MALATKATKVSSLSAMWKAAVPTAGSFSVVPEGDYVADLKELVIELSKKKQRLQVVSTYVIAMGDCEGKEVKRFDGLDNDTSMGFFKGYCAVIGFEIPEEVPENDDEFIQFMQESLDAFIQDPKRANDLFNINVSQSEGVDEQGKKKSYTNVYNNGLSDYSKGATEEAVEEESAEEVAVEAVEEPAQEVTAPMKRFAKPAVNGKSVAKPVAAKPAATIQMPARKAVAQPQTAPKRLAVRR